MIINRQSVTHLLIIAAEVAIVAAFTWWVAR